MKKIINIVVLIVALTIPAAAQADQSKMDLMLRMLQKEPVQKNLLLGKAVKTIGAEKMVSCFIKSTDVATTEAAIVELGGTVNRARSSIITAEIPMSALSVISDRDEVVAMEADRLLTPKMNAARSFTRVDDVQDGINVPDAYNGDGVMVGVVDDGLDWRNSDFSGRLIYVQQGSTVCDKGDIDGNSCTIPSAVGNQYNAGHGTHVTGIAAGADSLYKGVAPEAWIGFVFYQIAGLPDPDGALATAIYDGVDDLFAEADYQDLPAVVNLSLGTSLGAHDDTSLLEEDLNGLIGQGRLIVNAAGNENVDPNWVDAYISPPSPGLSNMVGGIHASVDTTTDTAWRFGVWEGSTSIVEIWLEPGAENNCTVDVKAYQPSGYPANRTNIEPPSGPNATTDDALISTNTPVDFNDQDVTRDDLTNSVRINVVTGVEGVNSKAHAIVTITRLTGGGTLEVDDLAYDVIIRPTSGTCRGDMWLYPDFVLTNDFLNNIAGKAVDAGGQGAAYVYTDGDSLKTTTIPGTASGIITVGSYMDRPTWVDIDGITRNQTPFDAAMGNTGGTSGQVSLFSSLGPTADGRPKPEVVAPGEPILSTLADGYTPPNFNIGEKNNPSDNDHHKLEGTSMSSPHVTGIVALMLGKNNCLTPSQVKTLLQQNSDDSTLTISYTTDPMNTYGWGIPDAVDIFNDTSFAKNTSCYGGGGSTKSGGCKLSLIPVTNAAAIPTMAMLFAPLAAMVIRRRWNK